jgi:hypothetical protein
MSEFPASASASDVNWELLNKFYERPHQLIRDIDTTGLHSGIVELLAEAKAVHHLLDLIGVPHGYSLDTRGIDARTLVLIIGMGNLRERLSRIKTWHARETGPAGMVGDFCIECVSKWPCKTYQMAEGTWQDDDA